MQEIHHDGSLGELHTADTLEELLPMIKKSLAKPEVKYVKIFNAPKDEGVHANEHKKDLLDVLKKGG